MTTTVRYRPGVVAVTGAVLLAVGLLGSDRSFVAVAVVLQAVFVLFFLRHFGFAVSALTSAPADVGRPIPCDGEATVPVTVLVACKNERAVVERLVTGLLALDYPHDLLQVLVVDDASTDGTGEVLDRLVAEAEAGGLSCVHRPVGSTPGKSAALNAALPLATGDVIVVFDADHSPRRDCIRRLVAHFRDPLVGAVQGRCEITNPGDSLVSRLIAIDYYAGYLVNEYGRQSLFQLPAYGGANCAVRASSVRALGGWNLDSVTEDTDLTLRLILSGQRVRFDVNAVDREEGVVSLRRFWRQRYRWARGHQQAWRDYRAAVWRSPHLSVAEKAETTMFLLAFHVPVAAAAGFGLLGLRMLGYADPVEPLQLAVFWTMLFLGPLLELGAGLLVAGAPRREARALAFFLPLFFVSIALCTKALIDAASGRRYGWVKTQRSADTEPAPGATRRAVAAVEAAGR
jgi:1,2-diacylglycerol 3-beta-glucosyltransferase